MRFTFALDLADGKFFAFVDFQGFVGGAFVNKGFENAVGLDDAGEKAELQGIDFCGRWRPFSALSLFGEPSRPQTGLD